jgi:hypothetical protein
MGLPPYKGDVVPTISDELADTYYLFLDRVKDYPVDVLPRNLKPLAKACYWLLVARVRLEGK